MMDVFDQVYIYLRDVGLSKVGLSKLSGLLVSYKPLARTFYENRAYIGEGWDFLNWSIHPRGAGGGRASMAWRLDARACAHSTRQRRGRAPYARAAPVGRRRPGSYCAELGRLEEAR